MVTLLLFSNNLAIWQCNPPPKHCHFSIICVIIFRLWVNDVLSAERILRAAIMSLTANVTPNGCGCLTYRISISSLKGKRERRLFAPSVLKAVKLLRLLKLLRPLSSLLLFSFLINSLNPYKPLGSDFVEEFGFKIKHQFIILHQFLFFMLFHNFAVFHGNN